MSFFIEDAMAEGGAAATTAPDLISQLMVFGGIFLIFYLLFIRPQNKKMKEHKQMVDALAKGDEVVTNGGVLGKVVGLHDSFVTIEVAADINLNVQRSAVGTIQPKGTIKSIKN
ncbi:MAG: preprotein translocase subunit YajC [gamma proteobacterium symbiont of Lucinoma myriamae]|nr:preprotein translocase subunit YajC [gamma proteobacterium symbiont of Lucinoma myriamae]MCU7819238.1 preprotein translocase subunit YajC [gamma proteobacterium symbiont of Lucinoma myriamae]MCU7832137.1 preprotein translocase subunit YajC [gamma proteobacterium symbiont of Lucinoma myriamae]